MIAISQSLKLFPILYETRYFAIETIITNPTAMHQKLYSSGKVSIYVFQENIKSQLTNLSNFVTEQMSLVSSLTIYWMIKSCKDNIAYKKH